MNIPSLTKKIEEISTAYSHKLGITRDSDWFVFKLQEELGELTQAYLMLTKRGRQKGKSSEEIAADFESEVADVFSHILLLAHHYNIDIEKAVQKKWFRWDEKE